MNRTDQKVPEIAPESPKTWEEVFAALDAPALFDGFVFERDLRPAEERACLNEFLVGTDTGE